MVGSMAIKSEVLKIKALDTWFDEINLPVAPSCNMMCNFCNRCSDCVQNGNNPEYFSKVLTPRLAVNKAITSAEKDKRTGIFKISGPGEPLCNVQTFEVLKRLSVSLPDYVYSVCTNGILLEEKAEQIAELKVKKVEVAINAVFTHTIARLYSRIVKNNNVVANPEAMAAVMLQGQLNGIRACIERGILVSVNTTYFPGINDNDIPVIAAKCEKLGVKSMYLIAHKPEGKLKYLQQPILKDLIALKHEVAKYILEVGIKSYDG